MIVDIQPITVSNDTDSFVCSTARVTIAMSDSVAIQLIPIDSQGNEHPLFSKGIVGTSTSEDLSDFFTNVYAELIKLLDSKGL